MLALQLVHQRQPSPRRWVLRQLLRLVQSPQVLLLVLPLVLQLQVIGLVLQLVPGHALLIPRQLLVVVIELALLVCIEFVHQLEKWKLKTDHTPSRP